VKSYYNAPPSGSEVDVALGLVPGRAAFGKFGFNPAIGTTEEDVWDIGGDHPEDVSAETWNIRSASTDDVDTTGTGAQTVEVYGLDGSYNLANETIEMNGTSNVATSTSYTFIHRIVVETAGSGGTAAGNIQATAPTPGTVGAQITQGYDQSLMAIYMVPVDHSLVIDGLYWGSVRNGAALDVTPRLVVKRFGGVWNTKRLVGGRTTGAAPMYMPVRNIVVPAKALVKVSAVCSAAGTEVFAGFDGTLVQV